MIKEMITGYLDNLLRERAPAIKEAWAKAEAARRARIQDSFDRAALGYREANVDDMLAASSQVQSIRDVAAALGAPFLRKLADVMEGK